MAALRAAEVELLITANDRDVERADKNVKAVGERIEKKPVTKKVEADEKDALAGMDRVEAAAKRIVSTATVATVDANIERGEKNLERVQNRLDYLRSVSTELDVSADVRRAEASLSKIERNLNGLKSARAVMEVDADTSAADAAIEGVADKAADAGAEGGADAGEGLSKGIVAALASIPIAGALVGIGATVASTIRDSFVDGLSIEVRQDRLQGLTGISEADAMRLARGAGEAYANAFGESIEANMDTARLALQFKLLDADDSATQSQRVIAGLSGIADVLGDDVQPVATAVATMLSSGIAKSAQEAFDILATGAREGVNRSEDLLDTFTEYPALFARLGLDAGTSLGIMNQGLNAGARNSDIVADALKEFQIRATDASALSAEGFQILGLNAEEMTSKIARGGGEAREGLQQVLDALRATEDPVARNAAAVALFGTQAEDLGAALFALDPKTAIDGLNGVQGAAQRMFDTIANNDKTKVDQAFRNIEVAADGIKGALAAAFADPLGELADFVSQNRGPVLQFLLDMANAGVDLGVGVVEGVASATEGLGTFVSGPLADFVFSIADVLGKLPWPFNQDTSDLKAAAEEMRGFEEGTSAAAEVMRTEWVGALEQSRDRLNEFGEGAVQMGYLNDASLRLAESLGAVGFQADGVTPLMDAYTVAQDGSVQASAALSEQIRGAIAAMQEELATAAAAGEGQDQLRGRYDAATGALVGQLTQMGLTDAQARALIKTYGAVPSMISTALVADTHQAQQAVDSFLNAYNGRRVNVYVDANGGREYQIAGTNLRYNRDGALLEFMAGGGVRGGGLSRMQPIAQVVPPSTWRVVGDRADVPESYIPHDGSARSWAILLETMRRFGIDPMGDGGITAGTGSRVPGSPAPQVHVDVHPTRGMSEAELGDVVADKVDFALRSL